MKLKLSIAALAFAASISAVSTSALAEPPSYPLLCRGGANMRIMVNHDVDGAGIPGATAMTIFFRPAGAPGSVTPPRPGECVWLDRTFRPGEPTSMWIRSPKVEFAFQVYGNGRVVSDTTGPRLNVEGAHISPEAQKWDYLAKGVMTGQLFTAHVYNESGRVMMITSVGP